MNHLEFALNPPKYAGFWIRLGSYLLDCVILISLQYVLAWPHHQGNFQTFLYNSNPIFGIIVSAAFFIGGWAIFGATPGKMILGLKVIDIDSGHKPSIWRSLGRYIGSFISSLVFLLGYLWIAGDKRKQGWHDKMANTFVVYKEKV